MAARSEQLRRRRWADIVILIASAYAVAAAAWFPPELAAGGDNEAVRTPQWLWIAYVASGVLGFAAVFVASRRPAVGKGMTALAGVVMAASFLTMARVTTLAVLSIGGTALALLAAAPFMGAMPSPREEELAERRP